MVTKLETRDLGKYLTIITDKGWHVYLRGTAKEKISVEASMRRGPVSGLELNVVYVVLPRVNDVTSLTEIHGFVERHQVHPELDIPKGGLYKEYGKIVAQFDEEGKDTEEFPLLPREHIHFVGFEFLPENVRLLCPERTFMPYEVFEETLKSLRNINSLERP